MGVPKKIVKPKAFPRANTCGRSMKNLYAIEKFVAYFGGKPDKTEILTDCNLQIYAFTSKIEALKFARHLNANVCLNNGEAGKSYSVKKIKFRKDLNVFLSANELI